MLCFVSYISGCMPKGQDLIRPKTELRYNPTSAQKGGRTIMRRIAQAGILVLMAIAEAFCQTSGTTADTPGSTKQYPAPKFDVANIDKSVDPCADFYQFACGNWIKKNPMPPDYPDWVSFSEVYEHNLGVLHRILDKASANDPKRSPIMQKIGDFYASCMDEKAVNAKGAQPIQPELKRIAALKNKKDMLDLVAREALVGPDPIFDFGSAPDLHNADMTDAVIDQSGLTLPDRDYYIKDDEPTVAIRKAFVDYMTQLFVLNGLSREQAAANAATVLKIETELAKAAMDRTRRRDPKNIDHKMT